MTVGRLRGLRDMRSALKVSIRLAWSESTPRSWLLVAVIVANAAAAATTAFLLSRVVSAAASGNVFLGVVGLSIATIALGLTQLGFRVQFSLNRSLVERAYLSLRREVAVACAVPPRLDHLEDAACRDRVEVVKRNSIHVAELVWTLLESMSIIAQLGVSVFLLASVDPALLLLLVLALPSIFLNRRATKVTYLAYAPWARHTRLGARLSGLLVDDQSRPEVVHHNAASLVADRAASEWSAATRIEVRASLRRAVMGFTGAAIFVIGYAAALFAVVSQTVSDTEKVATVVFIAVLSGQLQGQVGHAAWLTGQLTRAAGAASDFNWLTEVGRLHAQGERTSAAAEPARPQLSGRVGEPSLELRSASFTYPGAAEPALCDVDISLKSGDTLAIVGANGAGKSTLVKLLLGLRRPTGGAFLINGEPATESAVSLLHQRSAAAFQDFVCWEFPLGEVVALGSVENINDSHGQAAALREAGATDVLERFGLAAQLGSTLRGEQPSHGQWQKIAVARAIFKRADLVVYDEPTAALDPIAEKRFIEDHLLRNRDQHVTTVLVSHRFSSVAKADQIVVMSGGRIVERGTHAELVAIDGGHYQTRYQQQVAAYER